MHRELATSELESFPSLDWSDIAPRADRDPCAHLWREFSNTEWRRPFPWRILTSREFRRR